jgi:hypothetical protein
MAIGYPAEDPLTGGQRERKPFEKIYFKGSYGNPMSSDPKVVDMLKEIHMIQPKTELTPERLQEINSISRMMGLPEREG